MVILILGFPSDEHVQHVGQALRSRGCEIEVLDSRQFPSDLAIAFDPLARSGSIEFPSGRQRTWSEFRSVYWRNYGGPGPSSLPDVDQRFIANNDSRSLLETLLLQLPARWINGLDAYCLHQVKPVCLAKVSALGIRVPRTIVTNDPQDVCEFARQHRSVIFKPVQGGDQTRLLQPDHLAPENLTHLRLAPITLQEEVPGTNIRVFVAGERVMACEVATEKLDYREDPGALLTTHALPPAIELLSRRIARELSLLWTGIDFRLTGDGEYVFLEANPSPMFIGFERRTGLPLTEALVDLLVHT